MKPGKWIKGVPGLRYAYCALLLAVQTMVFAQSGAEQIGNLLDTYGDYGQLNGAVLVAEGDSVILSRGYGYANMEWSIANTPDTKFRLASISKQFTAMLVLQQVEKGAIELDAPISRYLPEYRRDIGARVTVHHLLTHTSGIPSYTALPGFMSDSISRNYTLAQLARLCEGDLEFVPGSAFRYNNSGYVLLGLIVEQVSGLDYAEALQRYIFEPLGMHDSGYDRHAAILEKRAAGYSKTPGAYENAPYVNMLIPYAAGGLYSTVDDLYRWLKALRDNTLLSAELSATMFMPVLNDYAYGWQVTDVAVEGEAPAAKLLHHNGGIHGFTTRIAYYTDKDRFIVILANAPGADLNTITDNIYRLLRGEAIEALRQSAAELALQGLLKGWSLERAHRYFENLRKEDSGRYYFSESEINAAGYYYLKRDNPAAALGAFRLNTRCFPQSANTFDSLGEAYRKTNDNKAALSCYRQVLKLAPADSTITPALRALLLRNAEEAIRELTGKSEN